LEKTWSYLINCKLKQLFIFFIRRCQRSSAFASNSGCTLLHRLGGFAGRFRATLGGLGGSGSSWLLGGRLGLLRLFSSPAREYLILIQAPLF